jgi:NitT/TauT family transport system ATP-binding protein
MYELLVNPDPAHAIALVEVGKVYTARRGEALVALTDTSLAIRDAEFVSVVGPSGCGKTTLMKIVAGLVAPSGGEVRVSGTPVLGPRPDVGVVFQQPLLLPWLRVMSNVLLPVAVQGRSKRRYRERAVDLLELAGLKEFHRHYPFELSGGMQQRVAIVRALIHEPSLLLMDEPFGALDALTREMMGLELQRIWEADRKTVVFITHSISEAVFLSDRVAVMTARPGRIEAVVDVDLPRPRDLAILTDDRFVRLTQEVREHLDRGTQGAVPRAPSHARASGL